MSAPRAAAGEACAVSRRADCAATDEAEDEVAPAGAASVSSPASEIADVAPGDRGGAQRGKRLRQLTQRAGDEEDAAQAGGERARAQRRLAESRRRIRRAPIKQPRGTTTVSAATARSSARPSRRIEGERAVLVAVPQLARLLRDERPLPDHALDEIVGERQPLGRPGPERPLHAQRERGGEESQAAAKPSSAKAELADGRHADREDAEAGDELEDAPPPR